MATAARAFQLSVEGAGTYINPADSALWLDLSFRVMLVGSDHRIKTATLNAKLDPTATGAAMMTTIAAAITDWATALGYTVAANQTFLLSFTRV